MSLAVNTKLNRLLRYHVISVIIVPTWARGGLQCRKFA